MWSCKIPKLASYFGFPCGLVAICSKDLVIFLDGTAIGNHQDELLDILEIIGDHWG